MQTSPDFAANPMGSYVDPDEMIAARAAGMSVDELHRRAYAGEFPPSKRRTRVHFSSVKVRRSRKQAASRQGRRGRQAQRTRRVYRASRVHLSGRRETVMVSQCKLLGARKALNRPQRAGVARTDPLGESAEGQVHRRCRLGVTLDVLSRQDGRSRPGVDRVIDEARARQDPRAGDRVHVRPELRRAGRRGDDPRADARRHAWGVRRSRAPPRAIPLPGLRQRAAAQP